MPSGMLGQATGIRAWAIALVALGLSPAAGAEPLSAGTEGRLAAPPERVEAVLLDLEGFGGWFPNLAEWRVLSRTADEVRVYGRQRFPWPASDRDYVARYRWWRSDGSFHLEAVGVETSDPPVPEDVVRLHDFRSEWRVWPDGAGGTRASYTAEGQVEGAVLRWLAGVAWRREARRVLDGLTGELARGDSGASPD